MLERDFDSDDDVIAQIDDVAAIVRIVTDETAAKLYERIARGVLLHVRALLPSPGENLSAAVEPDDAVILLGHLIEAALPFVETSWESRSFIGMIDEINSYISGFAEASSVEAAFEDRTVGGWWVLQIVRQLTRLGAYWEPATAIRESLLAQLLRRGAESFEGLLDSGLQRRPLSENQSLFERLAKQQAALRGPATSAFMSILEKWTNPPSEGSKVLPTEIAVDTRRAAAEERNGAEAASRSDAPLPGRIYISYAPEDNITSDGGAGWVTNFVTALRERLLQLVGTPSVSLDRATVLDISHESLMRTWDRLAAWVEQEAQSAQLYRRLAQAAYLHARGQAALCATLI